MYLSLQIYVTTNAVQAFGATCFFFVISQLPKLMYSRTVGELKGRRENGEREYCVLFVVCLFVCLFVGSLLCKKPSEREPIDGPPFIAGCITLLRQFHSDNTNMFFQYTGQYVRSMVEAQINGP